MKMTGIVVLPDHDLNGVLAEVAGGAVLVSRGDSHHPWVLPLRRFAVGRRVYNVFCLDGTSDSAVTAALRDAAPDVLRRADVSLAPPAPQEDR